MNSHIEKIQTAIETCTAVNGGTEAHRRTEEHTLKLKEIHAGVLPSCHAVSQEVRRRLDKIAASIRDQVVSGLEQLGAKDQVLQDVAKAIIKQRSETETIHHIGGLANGYDTADGLPNVVRAWEELLQFEASQAKATV